MTPYIVVGIVLQCAMVITGHYVEAVLNLSGPLGVGIPLILGAFYGAARPEGMREAVGGGFGVGFVGALVGILLAILIGDQPWILLTFGPISSGIIGIIGAALAFAVVGKKK